MDEWKKTEENGFSPDPKDVEALFRVAQSKISSGEATGAFILLCGREGFVYMGEELPHSRTAVAEAILMLESQACSLREDWEEVCIRRCERHPVLGAVEEKPDESV